MKFSYLMMLCSLATMSFGCKKHAAAEPITKNEPSEGLTDRDYTLMLLDHFIISDFSVESATLNDVIKVINAKLQSEGFEEHRKLKFEVSNRFEHKMTLKLDVITLKMLLDLVAFQLGCEYKVEAFKVTFYFDVDNFDFPSESDAASEKKELIEESILPKL